MKLILTKNQWQRISEISGNLGIVVFGATLIPLLFTSNTELIGDVRGLYITAILWYISIITARKY